MSDDFSRNRPGISRIQAWWLLGLLLTALPVAAHATELLAEACVAMALETTADELGRVIHAHPTVSESIMEAAEGVHDLTIHM